MEKRKYNQGLKRFEQDEWDEVTMPPILGKTFKTFFTSQSYTYIRMSFFGQIEVTNALTWKYFYCKNVYQTNKYLKIVDMHFQIQVYSKRKTL